MKEKGEAYKKPDHYEEIQCRKTAVPVSSLRLSPPSSVCHDLAYLVASDCWLRRHDHHWIVKSFDEDVDYYVPVAEIENWKTSISMRLLRQG